MKYETHSKWLVQYDREYQTKTWLDCETQMDARSNVVNELKCLPCVEDDKDPKTMQLLEDWDQWLTGCYARGLDQWFTDCY